MGFEQLIAKVRQAEDALEAQERRVVADVRQFKHSWRALWTPGRIVIAGLAAGFFVGRAEPLRSLSKGGGLMQLLSLLPGLLASGSAQAAADEVEQAAADVQQAAQATGAATHSTPDPNQPDLDAEALARGEAALQAARAATAAPLEP